MAESSSKWKENTMGEGEIACQSMIADYVQPDPNLNWELRQQQLWKVKGLTCHFNFPVYFKDFSELSTP